VVAVVQPDPDDLGGDDRRQQPRPGRQRRRALARPEVVARRELAEGIALEPVEAALEGEEVLLAAIEIDAEDLHSVSDQQG